MTIQKKIPPNFWSLMQFFHKNPLYDELHWTSFGRVVVQICPQKEQSVGYTF
jgi:hypothetical protein